MCSSSLNKLSLKYKCIFPVQKNIESEHLLHQYLDGPVYTCNGMDDCSGPLPKIECSHSSSTTVGESILSFCSRIDFQLLRMEHKQDWFFRCTYEVLAGAKTRRKIANKDLQPIFWTSPSIKVSNLDPCACFSVCQSIILWGKVHH